MTAIGRRKLGISHPKLDEVLHQDFADCSALAETLSGQDAAIFCLGTYTGSVSDAELRKITVDYTVEFARVLHGSSPDAAFSFLSGNGADPTGRSRMAFARYKGEAETTLLAAGFPRVYIFRPAYIYPVEPRKEPNFSYRVLRAIYPAFRVLFPKPGDSGRRVGSGDGGCCGPGKGKPGDWFREPRHPDFLTGKAFHMDFAIPDLSRGMSTVPCVMPVILKELTDRYRYCGPQRNQA